jgi:hypothetical protein
VIIAKRVDEPRGQRGPRRIDGGPAVTRRAHQPVHDRQIELRILRPELVDHRALSINKVERRPQAADPERLALDDEDLDRRRQQAAERHVRNPGRLEERSTVLVEVGQQDVRAVQPVRQLLDLAGRQAHVAVHGDAPHLQR